MLEFSRVGYRFPGGDGVADLTFAVVAEVVALIGLNGAGKTTLMRLGLGMLRAQHGEVRLFGHPLNRMPTESWAQVGVLIETPLAYPELSVVENLRIASLLHHGSPGQPDQAMETWQLSALAVDECVGCPWATSRGSGWPRPCSTIRASSSSRSRHRRPPTPPP